MRALALLMLIGLVMLSPNVLLSQYSDDEAERFLKDEIFPILNQARAKDDIASIKSTIEEIYQAHKKGSVVIVAIKSYFKHKEIEDRSVMAMANPAHSTKSKVDEISIFLPALHQFRHSDRLKDVVVTFLCHEWFHITKDRKFRHIRKLTHSQRVDAESKIWKYQVEVMLLPMKQAGRFLTGTQRDAVTNYLLFKDNPKKWRSWV